MYCKESSEYSYYHPSKLLPSVHYVQLSYGIYGSAVCYKTSCRREGGGRRDMPQRRSSSLGAEAPRAAEPFAPA